MTGGTTAAFAELTAHIDSSQSAIELDGEVHGISSVENRRRWFELIDRAGPPGPDAPSIRVSAPTTLCGTVRDGDCVRVRGTLQIRLDGARLELDAKTVSRSKGDAWYTPAGQRTAATRSPILATAARTKLRDPAGKPAPRRFPVRSPAARRLRVHWIGPKRSATRADIEAVLDKRVESVWTAVSFHDPQNIADAIRDAQRLTPRPDAIVVFRGGGSWRDWQVLGDARILNVVAAADVPVVTAVGHERDNPAVSYVAVANFNTPTDVVKAVNATFYTDKKPARAAARAVPPVDSTVQSALRRAGTENAELRQQLTDARQQLTVAKDQQRQANVERSTAQHAARTWQTSCIDRARQRSLERIRLRGLRQAIAVAALTALVLCLTPTLVSSTWWVLLLVEAGTLTAGILLVVAAATSSRRAQRPPRRPQQAPETGTDAWFTDIDAARTPRHYRRLQPTAVLR